MDKLVVVGQGYVGLPLAVRAAEVGFRVVGFDVDEFRVKHLASGESFVAEVSDERLDAVLRSGCYAITDEPKKCAGFDYAVISVPTPLKDGCPDLSYIEAASRDLARFVRPGSTVVLESSTYPGTTDEVVGPLLEEGSGLTAGEDFYLGYSPERIDPGNATWTLANTPKIVSGIDAASLRRIDQFYRRLVERTVPVSRPAEAELAKLLENTYRHVNIALVNETAMFAHELGIDIWEALDAAATKPFGYMRFDPGPGVGGHCLPVDPSYLSWRVRYSLGRPSRFIELANDINTGMPTYVVNRLLLALNELSLSVKGRNILLLGLSYKKNTGDARESPAQAIATAARRARRLRQRRRSVPARSGRASRRQLGRLVGCRAGTSGRCRPAGRPRPVRLHDDLELRAHRPRLSSRPVRPHRRGAVTGRQLLRRPRPACARMRTTYCGHASFRMTHGGASVSVDPWLSATGAFLGSWCQFPDNSGLDLDELRRSDYVLISHDHQDHFDLGFLRTLSPAAVVVIPRDRHSYLADTVRRELAEPRDQDRGPSAARAGAGHHGHAGAAVRPDLGRLRLHHPDTDGDDPRSQRPEDA